MIIYAKGKNINTYPFRNLLTQGEKLSEKIEFIVDRYCNGIDLLNCTFLIKGVTEANEEAEQTVLATAYDENKLHIVWNISENFTVTDGELTLEMRAVLPTDDPTVQSLILKYIMAPIYIRKSPNGSNAPMPDGVEQALNAISAAVSDGLSEIQALIDSFDISEVNARLDAMELCIEQMLARPSVKPITQQEYNQIVHEANVLYVIV